MARLTSDYGDKGAEQIRRQNNRSPQLLQARTGVQNKAPVFMAKGDFATSLHPRGALMAVAGDKNSREYIIIPRNSVQNLGTQFGTGLPTVDAFPNEEDYGWWIDESAGKAYWSINVGGTVYFTTSTVGGINFTEISGTITDTQHGNLGRQTGGSPHHTNATTTQPGFLSTTFFDLLNGATSAATASTLVLRNGTGGANFGGTLTVVAITGTGAIGVTGGNITTDSTSQGNIVNAVASFRHNGTVIINGIDTGWTAMTGTATRGGFDTATVTLPQLAEVVKAFTDAHLANDWIST